MILRILVLITFLKHCFPAAASNNKQLGTWDQGIGTQNLLLWVLGLGNWQSRVIILWSMIWSDNFIIFLSEISNYCMQSKIVQGCWDSLSNLIQCNIVERCNVGFHWSSKIKQFWYQNLMEEKYQNDEWWFIGIILSIFKISGSEDHCDGKHVLYPY